MAGRETDRDDYDDRYYSEERRNESAPDSDSQSGFATAAQWIAIGLGVIGIAAVARIVFGVI